MTEYYDDHLGWIIINYIRTFEDSKVCPYSQTFTLVPTIMLKVRNVIIGYIHYVIEILLRKGYFFKMWA